MRNARAWHTLTAALTIAALVLQLVLVIQGGRVLDEAEPPGLGLRLARFVAYFTIQSNLLVAVATTLLARDPLRDGPAFRALRLASTVGITVTGLVHFFLLRPLLDLHGADWLADKMLHMLVPVIAVAGWLAFGPRPRVDGRAVAVAFAWPIAWLAVTLVVAGATRWVPYPFLDFRAEGWGSVTVVCLGITALFAALIGGFHRMDRRLAPSRQVGPLTAP
ncbi:Pr6Pr family membrane protein [Nocardioides nitrophenolicus]|uniref:Pr6Pr family membrane protein n=1 Tax=Nocardioides nitrophenolicus TaxID=60489 RepID=UPI001956C101|nr:Pr6Pr family membrane protein [Nocardioides nitrophenolicus]MBM7515565.1 putative membrane protein SirB2 [Nocardioides nitrophenolicus]